MREAVLALLLLAVPAASHAEASAASSRAEADAAFEPLGARRPQGRGSEAAGKWIQAQLGSTQLPIYCIGSSGHMALREATRRRPGGGSSLKTYNDAAIGHGRAPVRHVRALTFDEAIR